METNKTRNMTLCGMFVALIAVGAFIRIPVPVVPFTLQFLFTMLAGLLLGGKLGLTAAYMKAENFSHVMLGGLTHEPVEVYDPAVRAGTYESKYPMYFTSYLPFGNRNLYKSTK